MRMKQLTLACNTVTHLCYSYIPLFLKKKNEVTISIIVDNFFLGQKTLWTSCFVNKFFKLWIINQQRMGGVDTVLFFRLAFVE